jgi:hypothetical protein
VPKGWASPNGSAATRRPEITEVNGRDLIDSHAAKDSHPAAPDLESRPCTSTRDVNGGRSLVLRRGGKCSTRDPRNRTSRAPCPRNGARVIALPYRATTESGAPKRVA